MRNALGFQITYVHADDPQALRIAYRDTPGTMAFMELAINEQLENQPKARVILAIEAIRE